MFRPRKPRQFAYEPVFFDEAKERRDEMRDEIEVEMGVKKDNDPKLVKSRMRKSMRASKHMLSSVVNKEQRDRRLRIVIILSVLCVLVFSLFILSDRIGVLLEMANK